MTMNTTMKLELMDKVRATNEERIKAFLQEGKTCKQWLIDCAIVDANNVTVETERGTDLEPFVVFSPDITDALKRAEEVLAMAADLMGWKKWMIWNIGIIDNDLF